MTFANNSNVGHNVPVPTEKQKFATANVCSPPTNRGVLPTSEEPNGPATTGLLIPPRTILDWVTCTFEYDIITMGWITGELGGMVERDRGMMGYSKSGSVLGSGSFCWSPNRIHQKMCLVLPSSALALFAGGAVELLQWLNALGATFTRIDLALDDYNGLLDLPVIKQHLLEGWVSSRWKQFRTDGDMAIGSGGDEQQTTIYIGSRTSDSFVRIYDKVAEQQAKKLIPEYDSWIRLELESKRDRANGIVQRILTSKRPCDWVATYINGLIEFKEPQEDDKNQWRWPPTVWWTQFLGTIDKARLSLPKKVRTIDSTKQWLWNNVAPNLALVVGAGEYDAVMGMVVHGADRWSEPHKRALVQSNLSADLARATLRAVAESQQMPGERGQR